MVARRTCDHAPPVPGIPSDRNQDSVQAIQPLLQPSHFSLVERTSVAPATAADPWQQLYYSELWIRTIYKYRALRSLQLVDSLTPKQAEQLSRLGEIVYEAPRTGFTPRRFRCGADARLHIESVMGIELDVRVLELSPCGAQVEGLTGLEGRRVTLIYKLQIFADGTLQFPARVISSEGGKLELAFIGAPSRTRHE